jgi:hypothetical protein
MKDILIPLDLRDIRFSRVPTEARGSRGSIYRRWVPYGMPQLGQYKEIVDTVFFLYPSKADALSGASYGGTGFLVAVPSKRWSNRYFHIHGITNWHVVCGRSGASCIRLNRKDGSGPEVLEYDPSEWTFKGLGSPDIAISPPLAVDPAVHKVAAINVQDCLLASDESAHDISAAEDVFMLGRFVDYDGVETNEPAFRFGNISILDARIKQETGYSGRTIVVDMHSRTGYSGSPVFIYRTPGSVFARSIDLSITWHFICLAGMLWGQFNESWELKDDPSSKSKRSAAQAALVTDGKYVEGLSGMSCVVPAEHIVEMLGHPTLVAQREAEEARVEPEMLGKALRPLPMMSSSRQFGTSSDEILRQNLEREAAMNRLLYG